jgi:hypothetical protein
MELLEVLITLPQTVTVPAGATTGTASVPTTADTMLMRLRTLWNCSATGTINDDNLPPTVTMLLLLKEDPVCLIQLEATLAVDTYVFTFTNGTAGVLITYKR